MWKGVFFCFFLKQSTVAQTLFEEQNILACLISTFSFILCCLSVFCSVSAWGRKDDREQLLQPHQADLSTCGRKLPFFYTEALLKPLNWPTSSTRLPYSLRVICRNTHISSPDLSLPSQVSLACSLTSCRRPPCSSCLRSSWVWDVSGSYNFCVAGLFSQAFHCYIGYRWGDAADRLQRRLILCDFACLWHHMAGQRKSLCQKTPEVMWQWILHQKYFTFRQLEMLSSLHCGNQVLLLA